MARIRTIKPQFFLNEEIADLPAMTRLLFIGLWTQADREGRLLDRPKRLKVEIFPYDSFDMEKGLKQLSDAGFILRYKVNANVTDRILVPEQPINEFAVIQVVNFSKHQKIDKANEKESDIPPIDLSKSSNRLPKDGEGKGKEGKEEGKETGDPPEPPPKTKDEIDFGKFRKWTSEKAKEVARMDEPFTLDEFVKIKAAFSPKKIQELLLKMHNWKGLVKKNKSAYLTFLNWSNNNFEKNEQPKQESQPIDPKTVEAVEAFKNSLNGSHQPE